MRHQEAGYDISVVHDLWSHLCERCISVAPKNQSSCCFPQINVNHPRHSTNCTTEKGLRNIHTLCSSSRAAVVSCAQKLNPRKRNKKRRTSPRNMQVLQKNTCNIYILILECCRWRQIQPCANQARFIHSTSTSHATKSRKQQT